MMDFNRIFQVWMMYHAFKMLELARKRDLEAQAKANQKMTEEQKKEILETLKVEAEKAPEKETKKTPILTEREAPSFMIETETKKKPLVV